ncbi:MAG: hypothetical protein WCM76_15880, partial [Bacteroidota bacterium]
MNKKLPKLLLLVLCFLAINASSQTVKTVGGAGANYSTLKQAFDAINAGTVSGTITLKITGSTTETASAILNATGSGSASYNSILIFPAGSGYIIGGSVANPLISLVGSTNVTIDGRVNQSGSTNLTIRNTNTISTVASTLSFSKSATGNTIRYCSINGSCIGSGSAMILFSTSTVGNGNDNNIIEYCSITNSGGNRPVNTVMFSGSTGRENSGNIIRNNNFYDFLNPATGSYGILFSSNSLDNTVTGNSFYETTVFAPQGANTYNPIRASLQGMQTISENYIGGSAPQCAGNPWIINANTASYFCAVFVSGGATTPAIVQGNIIRNINCTSVEDNPWDGIFINAGNVDVTGNIIGDSTGTGSIVVTTPLPSATATISGGAVTAVTMLGGGTGYTTPPAVTFSVSGSTTSATATAIIDGTGKVTGITVNSGGAGYTGIPNVVFDGQTNGYSTSHGILNASSGIVNVLNNTVGSVTTVSSAYYSHGFESVYVRGVTGTININNNLIGSRSTANSIQTSSSASISQQKQDVYGIYSSGLGTTTISGNTVSNLYNGYTGTNSGARARGISTISGSNIITNNIVKNISSASSQTSTRSSATVIGISQTSNTAGANQTVNGNTVCNLRSTNTTARVDVYGIYYSGPVNGTNSVSGNHINGITVDIPHIVVHSFRGKLVHQ